MRKIKLTQGLSAKIDDADFDWLNQFSWFAVNKGKNGIPKFYAEAYFPKEKRMRKRNRISMQRFILGLKRGDIRVGHHKNNDSLDNRRDNLQIVPNNHHNMLYSKNWRRAYGG